MLIISKINIFNKINKYRLKNNKNYQFHINWFTNLVIYFQMKNLLL